MVDIVHRGFRIDKLNEIFDNLDDVGIGKNAQCRVCLETQLLVQAVSSDDTEVISLFGEEELVDDIPCGSLIRRFRIPELLVDVVDSFLFRICRVFLQSVVDDGIFTVACLVLLKEDGLHLCISQFLDCLLIYDVASLDDRHGTLDRDDLTGILVNKVLVPGLEHLGSEFASFIGFEILLCRLDFLSKAEDVNDIFVGIVADSSKQCSDRQLLLTVDVGVHHVVDVRRELYPGALERNNPGRIELGSVGMKSLVEEYARGTVKLRNNDSF